jgi:GNAT superfamily N-acetyltransferase
MESFRIRIAEAEDAPRLAFVHVRSWQETYRGMMPDEVLDAPDFVARRDRFWSRMLTEERFREHRVAIAEADGAPIGVAMSGSSIEPDLQDDRQLFVLYLLAAHHGRGAGAALLDAVIAPGDAAILWVADPNPRAQAFYRRARFTADGVSKIEDGVTEIRMVRPPVE